MKLSILSSVGLLVVGALASPGTPAVDHSTHTVKRAACGNPFRYFGVNQAGAEFGDRSSGVVDRDYSWPSASSAEYFFSRGFNTLRIPFLMERVSSSGARGPFDPTYFGKLKEVVAYITSRGAYTVLDPHNFMRFNGSVINSPSEFQAWWARLASEFASNNRVIFDLMNGPRDIDNNLVAQLSQAAIDGIRSVGATSQLIIVEGGTGSMTQNWVNSGNGAAFMNIRDPSNNFAFGMRTFFDQDGYGSDENCPSNTNSGVDKIRSATDWLSANGRRGFLVEFGAGGSNNCVSAVYNALCSMQRSNVWLGGTYWSAGPRWNDYFMSVEPPNGRAIAMVDGALRPFL